MQYLHHAKQPECEKKERKEGREEQEGGHSRYVI